MSIRVEGDKLVRDYWIHYIIYTGVRAIVVTDRGTYMLEGEEAESLRDHPKANPAYVRRAKLRARGEDLG